MTDEQEAPSIDVAILDDNQEYWNKGDLVNYIRFLSTREELQGLECTADEAYDNLADMLALLDTMEINDDIQA